MCSGDHCLVVPRQRFPLDPELPLVGIWVRFLKIPYHYLVVIISHYLRHRGLQPE